VARIKTETIVWSSDTWGGINIGEWDHSAKSPAIKASELWLVVFAGIDIRTVKNELSQISAPNSESNIVLVSWVTSWQGGVQSVPGVEVLLGWSRKIVEC